jgi:hypothetical protein
MGTGTQNIHIKENKMSFRSLLDISDKAARKELGDYYIISEIRMNNYLFCLEDGEKQIQALTKENEKLKERIKVLEDSLLDHAL